MALLYTNTVGPRMRQIYETNRAYWRRGDSFDPDWDVPKIGISISFKDNPQRGRISMGVDFPETQHSQAILNRIKELERYRAELPMIVCPTLTGFPARTELASFCAKEKTHLSKVNRTRAAALLVSGYLWTMCEMYVAYGTPLIRPFPDEQRFKGLLSDDGRV